jgi:LPS export ABC transporter protein LptC
MAELQLKNNLKIIVTIIVVIGFMGILINTTQFAQDFFTKKDTQKTEDNKTNTNSVSYIEKIDNFEMQEFDDDQQIKQYIEAKTYHKYNNSPAVLLTPRVTIYNQDQSVDYLLNSERANILDNGDIKFIGKVDIKSHSGFGHNLRTEELLAESGTNNLVSNTEVNYYSDRAEMRADSGMHMDTKKDKMNLLGKTEIILDKSKIINTKNLVIDKSEGKELYSSKFATTYTDNSDKFSSDSIDIDMIADIFHLNGKVKILHGSDLTINTNNLVLDQSNDKERYYSKHDTEYLTGNNKVYSEAIESDMKTKISHLYGKVTLLQNSGSKIQTSDLVVDSSDGKEVYKTDKKVHYRLGASNMNAVGMYYDAINQLINLTGGVTGRYE